MLCNGYIQYCTSRKQTRNKYYTLYPPCDEQDVVLFVLAPECSQPSRSKASWRPQKQISPFLSSSGLSNFVWQPLTTFPQLRTTSRYSLLLTVCSCWQFALLLLTVYSFYGETVKQECIKCHFYIWWLIGINSCFAITVLALSTTN
jgi:hypothetical protein